MDILITGVTRGLGRALAEGFATRGYGVVGCGRSEALLDEVRAALPGADHDLAAVDVSSWEAVRAWSERVLGQRDPPELLINNAGLINENAPLWEVPVEELHAVVDTNVKGVYHVIRAFVPAMVALGRGVIVNLSSGWGRSTAPEVAPYCATKWAIEGLTQALAQELPPGLAAVALNPGIIDTDMLRTSFGPSAASYVKPKVWAERAVPFLLGLGPADSGRPLTVA